MISKHPKKLAADPDVLISALIGGDDLKILVHEGADVFVKRSHFDEVRRYVPRLASRFGLNETLLRAQLKMLPLAVSDDIQVAALVLTAEAERWSNQDDRRVLPLPVHTTGGLLKLLES